CATSTYRRGLPPMAWYPARFRRSTRTLKSRLVRRDPWPRPITFARCRSIVDCPGAPNAGPASWSGWPKERRGPFASAIRQHRRPKIVTSLSIRGTVGSPEPDQATLISRFCSFLVVVILIVVVVVVFIVVIRLTMRL